MNRKTKLFMTPFLAGLDLGDYGVIALIVFVCVTIASVGSRQQVNLRHLDRKLDALLQHHKIQLPSRVSPEVRRMAQDPQQKIAAIKLHRQQNPGMGLAEAKEDVEEAAL